MTRQSENYFHRALQAKTTEARDAVNRCIAGFFLSGAVDRAGLSRAAYGAVCNLLDLLHSSDRPPFLLHLHAALKSVTQQPEHQNCVPNMVKVATLYQPQLEMLKWEPATADETEFFDFDAVFERYRDECRIPELFDQLIDGLNKVVESGEVDSLKVLNQIRKIIATLRAARNGSYFSARGAWYFVTTWLKNSGWELLGDIPIAGAVVRGLRDAVTETSEQMALLHDKIQEDFEATIDADFPRLTYEPPAIPDDDVDPGSVESSGE